MNNEELQILLAEFNRQFDELRKDLNNSIEKISDKMTLLGESNISCAKDIEATRMWCGDKVKEMEKDMHGLGETIRHAKKDVLKSTAEMIKNGDLMTRLMIAGSYITGLSALIMFLANKYMGN